MSAFLLTYSQALTWLLRTVVSETNIHDILWYFVSALAGSNNSENKNEGKPVDAGAESTDEDAEVSYFFFKLVVLRRLFTNRLAFQLNSPL